MNVALYDLFQQRKQIKSDKKLFHLRRNVNFVTRKLFKVLRFIIRKIKYQKVIEKYRFYLYVKYNKQQNRKFGKKRNLIALNGLVNKVKQHLFIYKQFQYNLKKKKNKLLYKKYKYLSNFFKLIGKLVRQKRKLKYLLQKRMVQKFRNNRLKYEKSYISSFALKRKYFFNRIFFYPHLISLKLYKNSNNKLIFDKSRNKQIDIKNDKAYKT